MALPLGYLLTAAVAFVLAASGTMWLAPDLAGHYYHPRVVALAHTVTLGWITLTIMGASLQLIPVVLERPLWSERLARWQYGVLVVGMAGMISHFYTATWPGLAAAAVVVAAGTGLYIVNVAASMRGLPAWSFTARPMGLALAGLALTLVFGLTLAADRIWHFLPGQFFPTIHAHFHLALLGWIAPMVIGVAARVYPMFLMAPPPRGWPGMLQLWGLAVGVPVLTLGLLAAPALVAPGVLAVGAAVAGHVVWVARMAGQRERTALDWGLRFVLVATGFLAIAAILGVGLACGVLSGPRAGLAYAAAALGGWVSLTIVGMLLKIVPFLVWYRVYAPRVGRGPVPTLAALSAPSLEAAAFVLLAAGMAALTAAAATGSAVSIRLAGAVLTAGALTFAAALGRILRHLARHPGHRPTASPAEQPIR
ncbi:MAG TPA: hypothetical protein VMT79_20930 [Candidatus Binatia bacterium]|nr:hypothetical protein [Candidatus Binatia bacterium]